MKRKEIENRRSKPNKIITLVMNIIQILSASLLVYSLFLVSKIETKYIILGIIALIIFNALGVFLLRKLTKKNKLYKIVIFILLTTIITGIQTFTGYFIYKTYNSIDKVNKNEVTYKTNIIVMKESKIGNIKDLKDLKIGIVPDETSIDGYIMAEEVIKNKNLDKNNTINEYSTISEMIKALYDKKIDAAFTSSNYKTMLKSIETFKNIEDETKVIFKKEKTYKKDEISKIVGDEIINTNKSNSIKEPFTVLIMGIDSTEETLDKNATGNGDTLILVTFNPKTLNATIWSVPRDTYTYITCLGKENKITHAGWGGESCMIKTLEKFADINIDYYVKVNFKGVVKMVDALGGIDVEIPDEMDGVCEQDSNRDLDNQQCFTKGNMTLTGEQALALARHRKTLALGDFQRGLNQQLVIQGMLNKLKNIRSTSTALSLLNTISNSIDTNFTTDQLLSFYDIAKNLFTTSSNSNNLINLQQLYLMGSGQMIYDESIGLELYNFIPNKSSLDQITSTMKKNLGLEKIDNEIKTMDFNIEEEFEMKMIGKDNLSSTKTYTLLPSVVGQNINEAKQRLEALGLSVTIEEKIVTKESGFEDGQVLEQSYPEGKRVDLISGNIKLIVAKYEETKKEEKENNTTTDTKGFTNIEINIADTETVNTANKETYIEKDAGIGTGSITAQYDGVDITNEININVSYSDPTVTSDTPLQGTYTATYTATYKGETITTKQKTIIIQ